MTNPDESGTPDDGPGQPGSVPASQEVDRARADSGREPYRFAPRLGSDPDPESGGVYVEVDIPDGPDGRPSDDDLIAAMMEAIDLIFPDFAQPPSEEP